MINMHIHAMDLEQKDTDMKHTLQLNTTLITSLGHVLDKTNAELMEATGISNATWYRIMGHPDEITVQQLISIANGLCIPVFRLFSIDGLNVIGNKEDYIENPYKPCYYDAEALQALINTRSAAIWQDVANSLGITRTNLRNSLLSYTRLPVARFLAACDAFDIVPFLVIVDQNPQYIVRGGEKVATTALGYTNIEFDTTRTDFDSIRIELAEVKGELERVRRDIAELGKKLDLIFGTHKGRSYHKIAEQTAVQARQVAKEIQSLSDKQLPDDKIISLPVL